MQDVVYAAFHLQRTDSIQGTKKIKRRNIHFLFHIIFFSTYIISLSNFHNL